MTRHVRIRTSQRSDQELMRDVTAGNESAFRELYRRYSPRIRALVSRMLAGNHADTEDALQETWIRAVPRFGDFREASTLVTWLQGIAINVSLETIRRQRPGVFEGMHDESIAAPARDPAERMDLEKALARLTGVQRVVIVLHDVEGYTHEEIAQQLGIVAATSRSHLFRARRELRAMLDSYERIAE